MKTLKTMYAATAFALAAFAPAASQAAGVEVLNEGFNNVASLQGWSRINNSAPTGIPWSQGNPAVFDAQAGAANSYAAASYMGATNGNGLVDNWLITPTLTLSGLTQLSFFTNREASPGWADLLEVRFASGSGTDAALYTTLLTTIGGDAFHAEWQQWNANLAFEGQGRFAFRYLGDAGALSYIGLDTVRVVTAVPEPSLYLMLLAGLGLLGVARRRLTK
jgi:hypothetical protein